MPQSICRNDAVSFPSLGHKKWYDLSPTLPLLLTLPISHFPPFFPRTYGKHPQLNTTHDVRKRKLALSKNTWREEQNFYPRQRSTNWTYEWRGHQQNTTFRLQHFNLCFRTLWDTHQETSLDCLNSWHKIWRHVKWLLSSSKFWNNLRTVRVMKISTVDTKNKLGWHISDIISNNGKDM